VSGVWEENSRGVGRARKTTDTQPISVRVSYDPDMRVCPERGEGEGELKWSSGWSV
jgi:hypothetical protein